MIKEIEIKQHEIDEKNKILRLTVSCRTDQSCKGEKVRMSLLFEGSSGKRYYPVSAGWKQDKGGDRIYEDVLDVELGNIFFETYPQEEKVTVSIVVCDAESFWTKTEPLLYLDGSLFQKEHKTKGRASQTGSVILYLLCTLLLPLWIIDGILAQMGLHKLHKSAEGHSGKSAIFYHAHGLVKDWTGHGYSLREIKTDYFKRCYDRACRKIPHTEGILFLSERRVEEGGNLSLIRSRVREMGWNFQEFLVEVPVHRLKYRQIRQCAEKAATARVIVLEDFYPQLHALSVRKDTKILQMWHACGAFKLFGLSELGIVDHLQQSTRNHRNYAAALASSRGIVPFYSEAFGIDENKVRAAGVPRTDIFFDEKYRIDIRRKLLKKYPMCADKKVILFAPTFRGSGNKTAFYPMEKFPLGEIMDCISQDTVLILKNHPFVREKWTIEEKYSQRVLDLSEGENINDLLFISSVLITDYSSVIFEASLLKIPMLFYAFDLRDYLKKRDLYFDFASFVPGRIVADVKELKQALNNVLKQPEEQEKASGMSRDKFRELFLGALDGHSTERTLELITELLETDD